MNDNSIKTFTVGFDYDDFNEIDDARLVAKKYNTDHHEIKITTDIRNEIENILLCFGEPYADSSAIPTYYISKEIKKHVSVALSGDGGDELFGGYLDYGDSYAAEKFANHHKSKLKQQLVGSSSKVLSRINLGKNYGSELEYLKIKTPYQLYRNMGFHPLNLSNYGYFNQDFCHNYFLSIWNSESDSSSTTTLMRSSLKTRLINDYLVKVDRASMAHSLEVRSPFMDQDLANLAFSIQNDLKFKNGHLKYILKKIGQRHMYDNIFTKPKRGFGVPIKHWIKKELKEFCLGHIQDLINRKEYVNKNVLVLFEEHVNSIRDHTHKIWALVCLEIWLKKNL